MIAAVSAKPLPIPGAEVMAAKTVEPPKALTAKLVEKAAKPVTVPKASVVESKGAAQHNQVGRDLMKQGKYREAVEELSAAHYLVTDLTGITVEVLPGDEGLALHFTPLAV